MTRARQVGIWASATVGGILLALGSVLAVAALAYTAPAVGFAVFMCLALGMACMVAAACMERTR